MSERLEKMKAQRRQLDRNIRAAKRAKVKAEKEALQSERHSLGVWLSESVGADTQETVQLLKRALDSAQVRQHLARQVGTEGLNTSGTTGGHPPVESAGAAGRTSVPQVPV